MSGIWCESLLRTPSVEKPQQVKIPKLKTISSKVCDSYSSSKLKRKFQAAISHSVESREYKRLNLNLESDTEVYRKSSSDIVSQQHELMLEERSSSFSAGCDELASSKRNGPSATTCSSVESNNFSPSKRYSKCVSSMDTSWMQKRNFSTMTLFNSTDFSVASNLNSEGAFNTSDRTMNPEKIVLSEPLEAESLSVSPYTSKDKENVNIDSTAAIGIVNDMYFRDHKNTNGNCTNGPIEAAPLSKSVKSQSVTSQFQQTKLKCDNFVKLNMKQKAFCKANSKFALNRKRFKHKQFQRARSRYENTYSNSAVDTRGRLVQNGNVFSETSAQELPDSLSFLKDVEVVPTTFREDSAKNSDSQIGCHFTSQDLLLDLLPSALKTFKISCLQPWQSECIKEVVLGNSVLVIKPTGSGKSICYQMPALLLYKKFQAVALVVSPLISLMDDQVKNCPRGLKAACFHSALTESKRNAVLKDLQERKVAVLFVSPETIVEGNILRNVENFPPISFACIDEVHCISQWSHNFRPSYFRLCSVLKTTWNIRCVIGVTATASKHTMKDMGSTLDVSPERMFHDVRIPSNLRISVSCDSHRMQSLVDLLDKEPFKSFPSILIYCTKRNDCDAVASHLRTVFGSQDLAESYHAGKSTNERAQIQEKFMTEKVRIVAATVAFGMGLNKSAIRAVIHFNISGSLENYIQEIGRAGRNSSDTAYCHTFLNKESLVDLYEQERHIFNSYMEPSTIRKASQIIFKDAKSFNCEGETLQKSHWHYGAVELSTAANLDIKEEVLLTLVSYLEAHPQKPLCIEKVTNDICSVHFYKGFNLPRAFYDQFPVYKVALKLSENGRNASREGNKLTFRISAVANYMSWDLEAITKSLFVSQTKDVGIKISLTGKSVVFRVGCSRLSDTENWTEFLLDQTKCHENSKICSLHFLFANILLPVAEKSVFACFDEELSDVDVDNSEMASKIMKYFEDSASDSGKRGIELKRDLSDKDEHVARQKVRSFISLYHDMDLSGLAVCRVLQGMDSPLFPAQTWCSVNKFWKSLVNFNFKSLLKICNEEVMRS